MSLSRLEYKKKLSKENFHWNRGQIIDKRQQFILEQKCTTTSPLEVPTARIRVQKKGRCHICPKSDNKHALECKYCKRFICKALSYNVCNKCNK